MIEIETPPPFRPSAFTTVWAPIGMAAFGSALTQNQLHIRVVNVELATLVTGIQVFNHNPVSGNLMVAMYDIAGALLGSCASTAQGAAFTPQRVPFTSAVTVAPGSYHISMIISNGTGQVVTDSYTAGPSAIISPGSFTIPASITPLAVSARAFGPAFLATY